MRYGNTIYKGNRKIQTYDHPTLYLNPGQNQKTGIIGYQIKVSSFCGLVLLNKFVPTPYPPGNTCPC